MSERHALRFGEGVIGGGGAGDIEAFRHVCLITKTIVIISYFYQIHNESETRLRDIETRLNSSYNIAMTSYRSIVATFQNASRLFEEVKEAEGNVSEVFIVLHCVSFGNVFQNEMTPYKG